MRQAVVLSTLSKYTYPIVILAIAILLVFLGSFQSEQVRVKSEETQKNNVATGLANKTAGSNQDIGTSGQASDSLDNDTSQDSSTKVEVSIKTTTKNGNTTGSSEITVTQDGETITFNEPIDEANEGCDFDISVSDGEFDFDCDFDQDSKNETKIKQNIEIKNESD